MFNLIKKLKEEGYNSCQKPLVTLVGYNEKLFHLTYTQNKAKKVELITEIQQFINRNKLNRKLYDFNK